MAGIVEGYGPVELFSDKRQSFLQGFGLAGQDQPADDLGKPVCYDYNVQVVQSGIDNDRPGLVRNSAQGQRSQVHNIRLNASLSQCSDQSINQVAWERDQKNATFSLGQGGKTL